MSKSGYYGRATGMPTVFNLSVLDVLTCDEHDYMLQLIKKISARNQECSVKITFEVKECEEQ